MGEWAVGLGESEGSGSGVRCRGGARACGGFGWAGEVRSGCGVGEVGVWWGAGGGEFVGFLQRGSRQGRGGSLGVGVGWSEDGSALRGGGSCVSRWMLGGSV